MLQNYTYVDPVIDPLMLLAVMLGVVVLAAAAIAAIMVRPSRSSEPTTSKPTPDAMPFIEPEVERTVLSSQPKEDSGKWKDTAIVEEIRASDRRARSQQRDQSRETEPA